MQRRQILRLVPFEFMLLVAFATLLQLGFFTSGPGIVLGTIQRLLGTTVGLPLFP